MSVMYIAHIFKMQEIIHQVSSPMFIPLLADWREGNVSDRYVDKLNKNVLSSHGLELLGEHTKLFFDIDGKGEELMNLTNEFKAHLDELLMSGERKFLYCYAQPEDMEEVSVNNKRRKDYRKLSFHVIFEDKQIQRIGFKPSDEEETLKWLLGGFYEKLRPCVDNSVYDKNRKFRLPYFYNDDKPVALVACDETVDLTRFAVNLPPGCYKIMVPLKVEEEKEYDQKEEEEPISEERVKTMVDMLAMVKKQRFQAYDQWRKLLCLMRGNCLPKNLFLQISRESGYSKFSEEDCLSAWYKLEEKRTFGFPLLHGWLEEDGVDWKALFCPKKDDLIADLLKEMNAYGGDLTDKSIAEVFFKYYNTSLYYTQAGWIHYNEKRGWESGTNNDIVYPLMKLIGDTFSRFVQTLKQQEDEKDELFNKKKKVLFSQAKRLSSHSVCEKVIKTAQTLFKNDQILEKFDAKPHWFCFSDFKAIDMLTGNVVEIQKDDLIMTTCGYPMPKRDPSKVKEADDFIRTLVEPQNYESFLSMLACNFYGDPNKNQKLFVHTGTGGNGKSLIGLLMTHTLQNYAGILPIDQLTRDSKGRDEANSALFAMRGKRYAQSVEPEDSRETTLKVARVKELTGEDKIMVRELHGKSTKMTISFTLNIFCNEKPKMSKSDAAIERRLVVFPYVFQFVDFPDEEDPFQKQKDDMLGQKIKNDIAFQHGFLYLCLEHWRKCKGSFINTEAVKEANKEYLLENNPVVDWFNMFYELSDSDKFIRQKQLLQEFNAHTSNNLTSNSFCKFLQQLGVKIQQDKSNGNKLFVKRK